MVSCVSSNLRAACSDHDQSARPHIFPFVSSIYSENDINFVTEILHWGQLEPQG